MSCNPGDKIFIKTETMSHKFVKANFMKMVFEMEKRRSRWKSNITMKSVVFNKDLFLKNIIMNHEIEHLNATDTISAK